MATDTQNDTDLAGGLIAKADVQQVIRLDEIAQGARHAIADAERQGNETLKAVLTARAMNAIREEMRGPIMTDFMQLQGTPLGFVTDKDYGEAVVRDCVIEALLHGFKVVGNEFNILAGRFYAAKEGVRRVLGLHGVSDVHITLGVAEAVGKRWLVPGYANFKIDGEQCQIERLQNDKGDFRLSLPMYSTDKPATVEGKAESQMLKLIWKRATGTVISIGDTPEEAEIAQGAGESTHPAEPTGPCGTDSVQIPRMPQGTPEDTRPLRRLGD